MAGLLQHVGQRLPVGIDRAILRDGHLQRASHGRQRAAEFVGGVGHELLLPLDVPRHFVKETVDRQRQAVELVLRAMYLQPVAEPRRLKMLGCPEDLGQRLGGAHRQPVAHQRRQ